MVRKVGTDANDFFAGTRGRDFLFGNGGGDTLLGGDGNDFLVGGSEYYSIDSLEGGKGNDVLFADDFITLSRAQTNLGLGPEQKYDSLKGGVGDDILVGTGDGGEGNDVIIASNPNNEVLGGSGNDILINGGEGGSGSDLIVMTQAASLISTGNGAWEDGAVDRVVIDGDFSGNITINGMDKFDVLEFRHVAGISNMEDISIRKSIEDIFGLKIITIRVDADTTITVQGVVGKDIKYAFNATNTEHILAGINSKLLDALGTTASTLTSHDDRYVGGLGRDLIKGLAGNDTLLGGGGDDTLVGGYGKDALSGGGGADHFVFNQVKDSDRSESQRDVIDDFSSTHHDKIDLSTIDANIKKSGDQDFSFIWSSNWHKTAGELRYRFEGHDKTIVEGDTDGNGRADFEIELSGHKVLKTADFIL